MKGQIQVIGCKSCTEIPQLIDMNKLIEKASTMDLVVSTVLVGAVCDSKSIKQVVQEAKEREVDRVVVLACPKKVVNPALLAAFKKAKVNEFLVEYVNIRDEVVLPHMNDPPRAQAKAETMMVAALQKVMGLKPLETLKEQMRTRNVVVLGGGASGRKAAETAAKTGAHTIIIEKGTKSFKAPGVLMQNSVLLKSKGYGGNFVLTIRAGEKVEELECAAIVVATGGGWTTLNGPLAKACKSALPLYELDEQIRAGKKMEGPIVIVDSPDPAGKSMQVRDYAWDESLELAIELKRRSTDSDITIVFQEMRAFGLSELRYKEAAELGVRFIRYDPTGIPKIDPKEPNVISVKDLAQGETIRLRFGTLAFASIPANDDNEGIADTLRIPMSPDGGIRHGSIQRGPVSTPRPGIFVCGSALFPKTKDIAEEEGIVAGELAGEFASKGIIEYGGSVAEVTQEKCSACLTCIRTCPYEAPFIGIANKAEIRTQACQGCGMCVGICPSKAIELRNCTDDLIMQETKTMLRGDF